MIRCLIFDCDGTLVDSEFLCNLGLEIKLRDYGVESSAHEMMQEFRGGKLADILTNIEQEYGIVLEEGFVAEYRAFVDQLFEEQLKPCDGVMEFLSSNALPVCVASSGPIKKIQRALDLTGLRPFFGDRLFSSYQVDSWKPEPDLFLHAASQMGVRASECLVIEDSEKGIQAGINAGMKTILFDPQDLYEAIYSDYRIATMTSLTEVISAIGKRGRKFV